MFGTPGFIQAQGFYSVDAATDELVHIDSTNGHVTVIGAIGFDALNIDLARVGNQLFGLDMDFQVRVDLHELDMTTGAALSSVQVAPGVIFVAEGLGQANGQLKIGYSGASDFFSDTLADLALDGSISNSTSIASLDFDGLGDDSATGTLYGCDVEPALGTVDFFDVTQVPFSVTIFKTLPSSVSVNDVTVTGTTMYGIDASTDQLQAIDLNTLVFSSIDLDRGGNYQGLVNAGPQTWVTLGGGTTGIAGQPTLTGTGTLVGGTSASLSLTNAPSGALLLAWISFAPTPFMALDGTIHAFPYANQLIFNANGAGVFAATTTWPPGVPVGTNVWFQFLVQDASSIHGITVSNGLLATTP